MTRDDDHHGGSLTLCIASSSPRALCLSQPLQSPFHRPIPGAPMHSPPESGHPMNGAPTPLPLQSPHKPCLIAGANTSWRRRLRLSVQSWSRIKEKRLFSEAEFPSSLYRVVRMDPGGRCLEGEFKQRSYDSQRQYSTWDVGVVHFGDNPFSSWALRSCRRGASNRAFVAPIY